MLNSIDGISAKPTILVLLAAFNGERWIVDQINSILSQENVCVSIIVSDDCSTDGTYDVVVKNFSSHKNITINKRQSPTGSAGKNFKSIFVSILDFEFDFVALADQDDIWLPEKLHDAVAALNSSNASGYSSSLWAFWENERIELISQKSTVTSFDFLFEGAGQGCTFVLPMQSFISVREFCKNNSADILDFHYHDWLVYLLIRSWGLTWFFDAKASIRYRQHKNNEIGAKAGFYSYIKRLKLIRSGWYMRQIQKALKLSLLASASCGSLISFEHIYTDRHSFFGRFRFMYLVLINSRRRFSERISLFFFALLGWL